MIRTFTHRIPTFHPVGVLAQLGVTPLSGVIYYQLLPEVTAIIETQAITTAERLNQYLKEAYRKDMAEIDEYSRFPAYFTVMDTALSQPRNIGFEWDSKGLIQAKFVDLDALGDIGDLQRIQKMVHPGGTLQGWIGIYNSWLAGTSKKYEEIVGARTSIMLAETKAPFWELIENGNGPAAYPRNGPKRTLLAFKVVYNREMKAAYLRTLSVVRALVARPSSLFAGYQATTVSYRGQLFAGHVWTSPTGTIVFAISGTTAIDRLGRLTGRGFILDVTGTVIRRWSGWLPR